jgi:hypothetical protein
MDALQSQGRDVVRYAAAAASAIAAGIYFLIGFEVVNAVTDAPATADIFAFGVAAGTAFVVAAALLILVNQRWVWVVVAGFALLALGNYIAVAPLRDPPVEVWGLLVSLLEVFILAALIYAFVRRPDPSRIA